jgi:hypothetical protein
VFEIARMFGGWPHEVAAFPVHYFLKLRDYYLETKKQPDDPNSIDFDKLNAADLRPIEDGVVKGEAN